MALSQLGRHWAILKRIPNWGSPTTVTELADYLITYEGLDLKGIKRTSFIRKIQHDVANLASVVEYLAIEDGPNGQKISWARNAPPLKISALSTPEILAFGVLKKLNSELLPKTFHEALAPFFKVAQEQAAEVGGSNKSMAARWLKKIGRLPEGPDFAAPPVRKDVELAVHAALLEESRLEIVYRGGEPKVVHPQAIIQQGVRTYLLAMPEGRSEVHTYLLHRIDSAKQTIGHLAVAKDFDLGQRLKRGISSPVFEPARYGTPVMLMLWVNHSTAWLEETPLGIDQTFKQVGDDFHLEATVNVTEELIRWILSMGRHVKVLGPAFIRERIKSDLESASRMYS
jgi:predicted DNA-binding transcriptional regulator YafY